MFKGCRLRRRQHEEKKGVEIVMIFCQRLPAKPYATVRQNTIAVDKQTRLTN
jgi:hypothetical protein